MPGFATPVQGEAWTEVGDDAVTDFIQAANRPPGAVTFTPSIDATTEAPTYHLETVAGFWGGPSYGWYEESDTMVDFGLRVVASSMSDYGDGQWFTPLPVEPFAGAGPYGLSWIIDAMGSGTPIANTRSVVDPVYTAEGLMLFRTGDRLITGDDSDWIAGVTDGVSNPPLVGTLVIVAASGRYRKA